jgi:hypothetical protein
LLPSGQKLTLGLLSITITLFPVLLPSFKCILEVMFCEGGILPQSPQLCQNGGLSVLSSISETEKSRVGAGNSHAVFGQKFPGEKESGRWCVVVMQEPVLLSPKFGVKSSTIFIQSPKNVTVVCKIDCLACQEEFFVNNPPDDYLYVLDFILHPPHLFHSRLSLEFPCMAHASSPNACLIIARVSVALFLRFAHCLMLFLCQIHREIASGRIHDSK